MRAWVGRDRKILKGLTSSNFRMVVSSKPPVILDGRSWLEAAVTRYRCDSYRFGEVYVRGIGPFAIFATRMEVKATISGEDWSGELWVTDLWRKTRLRRNWRMVERVLSRPEEASHVPPAIRSLQLWR